MLFNRKCRTSSANNRRQASSRLQLESFEDRCLLSAGVLDPTFGVNGIATTVLPQLEQGNDIAIYPPGTTNAGKIVVGGGQAFEREFLLLRYNTNGTLDTSFDRDGVVTTDLEQNNRLETVTAIAIQPDGKIVAGGYASTNIKGAFSFNANWRLVRYNVNGSLDKTFDGDGKLALFPKSGDAYVRDLLVQPDGKIVVIGWNNGEAVIARFLSNGKLDASFDGDGMAAFAAHAFASQCVALQPDGKIVISGSVPEAGSTGEPRVDTAFWRFNANGSLDATFGDGGRVVHSLVANAKDSAVGLALQPADGKIVAIVDQDAPPGAAVHPGVVTMRIESSGAMDTSYGVGGISRTNVGYVAPGKYFAYTAVGRNSLSIQPDGKPVLAVRGQYSDLNPDGVTYTRTTFSSVLRYTPNGVLDDTWASTTQVTGTASGTGPVDGTLHWGDAFTFTAPTGAVTQGDTITATFTVASPITLSGDVAGPVTGSITGTASRTSFTATEETWRVTQTAGTATGTVTGSVTGTVTGGDTVTGAIVVSATGTPATITDTTKGTLVGTNTGSFTGSFASQLTLTGTVTGAVSGGVVRDTQIQGAYHGALQADGKIVTMGRNADSTDIVMARYLGDSSLQASSLPSHIRSTTITAVQTQPLLDEAIRRWTAAGLNAAAHGAIDIRIANLGGRKLGLAAGHTIWLDDNATGWGWFVDPTPGDDLEFSTPGNQGEKNRIDLLTVLEHEIGHLLGYDHGMPGASAAGDVMLDTLDAGTRRMPTPANAADEDFVIDSIFVLDRTKWRRDFGKADEYRPQSDL